MHPLGDVRVQLDDNLAVRAVGELLLHEQRVHAVRREWREAFARLREAHVDERRPLWDHRRA